MDNKYMQLPYLPSIFEEDKRFLEGKQEEDIKLFIKNRYQKNKDTIIPIFENTTKAFIRNGSNIYSKKVEYPDWEEEEWIERRKSEINKMEQYYNLNKQALFWTYKYKDKVRFKALHPSEFVISQDVNGEIDYVIIRTGSFLKNENGIGRIWFYFKMWRDGKVYKTIAENWDRLPLSEDGWQLDDISEYKELPFSLIGEENPKPYKSILPNMEKILSGGIAWGDISAQRNFLKLLYGITDLTPAQWKEFNEQIGLFQSPNLPINEGGSGQSDLRSLDLGDGKAQLDWEELITKSLKRLAYSEGVDINGLFGELKVESGVARLIAMENIISVRDSKIQEWKQWEDKDQEILIELGIVKNKSEVIYAPLNIGETQAIREDTEKKRQENILNRYKNGTITKIQMISEMEKITIEEAKQRYNEVMKERIGENEE